MKLLIPDNRSLRRQQPSATVSDADAVQLDRVAEALRLVHESDGYPMAWPDDPAA